MSHSNKSLCPYFTVEGGMQLPNTFANRAVWALWALKSDPSAAQVDAEGIVWMQSQDDGHWYSIKGNYSRYSPHEKVQIDAKWEEDQLREIEIAKDYYDRILYQSGIRSLVLERDEYTCQICGKHATSRLHVHHILKRKEGGTDHLDNLVTVCSGCHKKADGKLYDPEWTNPRDGVV